VRGVISEFDDEKRFGIIDGDDGGLVIFNLEGCSPPGRDTLKVGMRVGFTRIDSSPVARAVSVVPVD
jgi:cold shock CspA family protein